MHATKRVVNARVRVLVSFWVGVVACDAQSPVRMTGEKNLEQADVGDAHSCRAGIFGYVAAKKADELSGLIVDPQAETPRLISHNDGAIDKLLTFGIDGSDPETYALDIEPVDVEDIAIGIVDGDEQIVLGDIGDNELERDTVGLFGLTRDLDPNPASILELRYADDQAHDAEALVFDGQTPYVISKRPGKDLRDQDPHTLVFRGELETGTLVPVLSSADAEHLAGRVVAADQSPDGTLAVVFKASGANDDEVRILAWGSRPAPLEERMASPPAATIVIGPEFAVKDPNAIQIESVALSRDGATMWLTHEGDSPAIYEVDLAACMGR